MLDKAKALAEVLPDQSEGVMEMSKACTNEVTARSAELQIQSYDDLRRLTRDMETRYHSLRRAQQTVAAL